MLVQVFSKDGERLKQVNAALAPHFSVAFCGLEPPACVHPRAVAVFAVDLRSPDTVKGVKAVLQAVTTLRARIFVLAEGDRRSMVQAYALGATSVVSKMEDLRRILSRLRDQDDPPRVVDASRVASDSASVALSEMFVSALSGGGLDMAAPIQAANAISEAIRSDGLANWLDTVRRHHESTYQHCLLVTGIAADFGHHLGMRKDDISRLYTAAMFHDIGKAFIPLSILDKPGRLDAGERAAIESHPALGYDLLAQNGSVSVEVLDAVRHHHEYLDGSGYPDKLGGEEVSDLVRMLTICDIFAALIEDRGYKPTLPRKDAYDLMRGMVGKIEKALFAAFAEVALTR